MKKVSEFILLNENKITNFMAIKKKFIIQMIQI